MDVDSIIRGRGHTWQLRSWLSQAAAPDLLLLNRHEGILRLPISVVFPHSAWNFYSYKYGTWFADYAASIFDPRKNQSLWKDVLPRGKEEFFVRTL
jgi:hypothetical protein